MKRKTPVMAPTVSTATPTPPAAPAAPEAVPARPGAWIRTESGELIPDPTAELTKPRPPVKPPGTDEEAV